MGRPWRTRRWLLARRLPAVGFSLAIAVLAGAVLWPSAVHAAGETYQYNEANDTVEVTGGIFSGRVVLARSAGAYTASGSTTIRDNLGEFCTMRVILEYTPGSPGGEVQVIPEQGQSNSNDSVCVGAQFAETVSVGKLGPPPPPPPGNPGGQPPPREDPGCAKDGYRWNAEIGSCYTPHVNGVCHVGTIGTVTENGQILDVCLVDPAKVGIGRPDPQCAVVGFGPVRCQINEGIPIGSSGCFVHDPKDPFAGGTRWQPKGQPPCQDPAFIPPSAVDCSDQNVPESARAQYCDPAPNCTENCNLVTQYINPLIKALSALIGVGVTLAIIMAGIQYSRSANDPQAVASAKRTILIALLTLVGYFLLYQFINWVVPGGIG